MAGQNDTCWRCGAQWASEDVPPTTLRLIAGGRLPSSPVAPARAGAVLDAGVGSAAVAVAVSAVALGK
jgi:hypothetical protein